MFFGFRHVPWTHGKPGHSGSVLGKPDFFNVFEEEDLDDTNVGYLCGEMLEDFVDDNSDHLSCNFKTVFKKNKSPSMSRPKGKPKFVGG